MNIRKSVLMTLVLASSLFFAGCDWLGGEKATPTVTPTTTPTLTPTVAIAVTDQMIDAVFGAIGIDETCGEKNLFCMFDHRAAGDKIVAEINGQIGRNKNNKVWPLEVMVEEKFIKELNLKTFKRLEGKLFISNLTEQFNIQGTVNLLFGKMAVGMLENMFFQTCDAEFNFEKLYVNIDRSDIDDELKFLLKRIYEHRNDITSVNPKIIRFWIAWWIDKFQKVDETIIDFCKKEVNGDKSLELQNWYLKELGKMKSDGHTPLPELEIKQVASVTPTPTQTLTVTPTSTGTPTSTSTPTPSPTINMRQVVTGNPCSDELKCDSFLRRELSESYSCFHLPNNIAYRERLLTCANNKFPLHCSIIDYNGTILVKGSAQPLESAQLLLPKQKNLILVISGYPDDEASLELFCHY